MLAVDKTLTLDARRSTLENAMLEGRPIPAGRLLGLPELPAEDVWVDIAGAAALTRVKPKTITGWLTRKGPKRRPFPTPDRILYRLYWKRSAVERWLMAADD